MTKESRWHLYVLLGVGLFVAARPSLAQPSLQINAQQSPGGAGVDRQQIGARFTFICPASDGKDATVYGTDVYTDNSPICPAAIHAGVLRSGSTGVVSIVLGSGSESFEGTERNGVTTRSYGRWGYSYTFARDDAPATVTWRTTWNWNERQVVDVATPIAVECPAAGKPDAVIYGDGIYTLDSAICVAAVHAGAISAEQGGVVSVTMASASSDDSGGERFGIVSRRRSATAQGFQVAATTQLSASTLTTAGGSADARSDVPESAATTTGSSGSLVIPPEPAPPDGVTLSTVAPSTASSGERVRERPAAVNFVRNTSSVMASVNGIAVTVTWSPVLGASWYGVAGQTQNLWREVVAPVTSVKYYLGFGEYTFAVGSYFEPGTLSTPAGGWPTVTATVVRPQTPQQIAQYNASVQQALLEEQSETIAAILTQRIRTTSVIPF